MTELLVQALVEMKVSRSAGAMSIIPLPKSAGSMWRRIPLSGPMPTATVGPLFPIRMEKETWDGPDVTPVTSQEGPQKHLPP